MKPLTPFLSLALLAFLASGRAADSDVILNELMYHPPEDRDDLQWIELFNRGSEAVDLSGWSFKKGVEFVFPAGTTIESGGFIVVARDTNAFATNYAREFGQARLFGNFSGRLSHGGETVALANRQGKTVDAVKYSDRGAWSRGADGLSASLERISPDAAGGDPANWAASKLPATMRAAGSPRRRNDGFAARSPPVISDVKFLEIPAPGAAVLITAGITNPVAVKNVALLWQSFSNNVGRGERTVPMQRVVGDERGGRYEAMLPGQPSGTLTRFRLRADDGGATRFAPGENEPRPTFSIFHFANTNRALIPFAFLVRTGAPEKLASRWGRAPDPPVPVRGHAAFIFADTNRGPVRLFDHVRLQPRGGGWKIHFQHDRMFHEMTSLNVIFETPRATLAEPLGDEIFRRAGVPAPEAGHLRVWENGQLRGYCLAIEQVNQEFLARRNRAPGGDMFKLLWYGNGVVGQHEKKTNPRSGHTNLLALLAALENHRGGAQWEIIRTNFNVDEVAGYFAVNQLIANWDGYHNNHFIYDVPKGARGWEIFPWDLDKTFGDFDSAPKDFAWFDLPLTYGMEGDVSPPADPKNPTRRRGGFGGVSWWREGGPFSRPLLANAEFRARYLARLRTLCETEFTEEKLFPWIAALEQRLEPEVRLRATVGGKAAAPALEEFHAQIESLRRFITGRRAFLLRELKQLP